MTHSTFFVCTMLYLVSWFCFFYNLWKLHFTRRCADVAGCTGDLSIRVQLTLGSCDLRVCSTVGSENPRKSDLCCQGAGSIDWLIAHLMNYAAVNWISPNGLRSAPCKRPRWTSRDSTSTGDYHLHNRVNLIHQLDLLNRV